MTPKEIRPQLAVGYVRVSTETQSAFRLEILDAPPM